MVKNYDEEPQELTKENEAFPLLDSKLIVTTILENKYNIKLVNCGDYVQIYVYEKCKKKNLKNDDVELQLKKQKINKIIGEDFTKKNKNESKLKDNIETKNIIRSKLECQRIAKANLNEWKTFITLTFKENVKDVQLANKRFRYFVDKIQRVKKDFKYIAIPEFQKRGATHYHLLTNIDIEDKSLIVEQDGKSKFKHVKYWHDGFNKVDYLKGDTKKIIGYISKL